MYLLGAQIPEADLRDAIDAFFDKQRPESWPSPPPPPPPGQSQAPDQPSRRLSVFDNSWAESRRVGGWFSSGRGSKRGGNGGRKLKAGKGRGAKPPPTKPMSRNMMQWMWRLSARTCYAMLQITGQPYVC